MNSVIAFPIALRRAADMSPDALLRRCRIAARIAGCNQVQRATVEQAARVQLDNGGKGASILTAARALAQQLVRDSAARVEAAQ